MGSFRNLDISASGMSAHRTWMEVISSNIANAKTTKTAEGGPYRAKNVSFAQTLDESQKKEPTDFSGQGVRVENITPDPSDFVSIYYPSHPDANSEGYVQMPNVNTMQEMAKMMIATRSYEANVAAFTAGKNMYLKALEIGR